MKYKNFSKFFLFLTLLGFITGSILFTALPVLAEDMPEGDNWYKGNLHCHTTNSDGKLTPVEVINQYKEKGYDFIAITDHERMTQIEEPSIVHQDFILITGEEINNYNLPDYAIKHFNGINLSAEINPVPEGPDYPDGMYPEDIIKEINSQEGSIAILNHPLWTYNEKGWGTSVLECKENIINFINEKNPDIKYMEIYNYGCESIPTTPPGMWHDDHQIWDALLSMGKKIYGIAADDAHSQEDIGHAWIMVHGDSLDKDSLMKAIEGGDFYSSTGIIFTAIEISEDRIHIESENGETITFIGINNDESPINMSIAGREGDYEITGNEAYVRVAAVNSANEEAWTQPLIWNYQPEDCSGK